MFPFLLEGRDGIVRFDVGCMIEGVERYRSSNEPK